MTENDTAGCWAARGSAVNSHWSFEKFAIGGMRLGGQGFPVLDSSSIPWFASASKRQRYLVGVSGGADSVALLHLLLDAGFHNLVVCHLNHGLRGRASGQDARFVGRLCARMGILLESGRDEVGRRIEVGNLSLETAAREARHEFFARCAVKHRCDRVLLAHHAEDQAETVLWNLLRGSHGLKGMRSQQAMMVGNQRLELIRPLLGVRKAGLVDYLTLRGLKWREDESNGQPIAVRNRMRHEGLPLLAEIAGRDPIPALVRGAADAEDWDACVREMIDRAAVLDPQGRLHLVAMRRLPIPLQRAALRDFLMAAGVSDIDRPLLERSLKLLDPHNPAVVNLPGNRRLRRREGRMWVEDA